MNRLIPVFLILFTMGCQHTPTGEFGSDLRATVLYRNLQGEPHIAIIGLHQVISDQKLLGDAPELQKTDRSLVTLSHHSDGIFAESQVGDAVQLVKGRSLSDPALSITSYPDVYVLSYIAMQGRKPVLKLRTINKGLVNQKGFIIPLSSNVDKYDISDFTSEASK